MLSCLDEGYPFVFGLRLTKSFNQIGGLVPIPEAGESVLGKHSNHAMLCVGYNKKEKIFIVRNSWGSEWGDGGYCYIPFDYMTSNDMMLGAFTIRSVDEQVNEIIKTNIWGDDLGYFKGFKHVKLTKLGKIIAGKPIRAQGVRGNMDVQQMQVGTRIIFPCLLTQPVHSRPDTLYKGDQTECPMT